MRNILSLIGDKIIFVSGFILVFIAIVILNAVFSIIDLFKTYKTTEN